MSSLHRALALSAFFGLLMCSTILHAYCIEPSAPDAPFSRPSAPWCLSDYRYSGQHDCDEWEIDSYIREIKHYLEELQAYLDEVNEFSDDAVDYAECEAAEAKKPLGY